VKIVSKIKLEAPEKKKKMGRKRRDEAEPGGGFGKPAFIDDIPQLSAESGTTAPTCPSLITDSVHGSKQKSLRLSRGDRKFHQHSCLLANLPKKRYEPRETSTLADLRNLKSKPRGKRC
jgi:hypothetical protein